MFLPPLKSSGKFIQIMLMTYVVLKLLGTYYSDKIVFKVLLNFFPIAHWLKHSGSRQVWNTGFPPLPIVFVTGGEEGLFCYGTNALGKVFSSWVSYL